MHRNITHLRSGLLLGALAMLAAIAPATAQTGGKGALARYFGFEEPRIVVVDRNPGPSLIADMDGDGRNDLVIVNNRTSRIEIHRQRARAQTPDEIEREFRVNQLPPSPYFERVDITVPHQVTGIQAYDINADGRLDLIYAGQPAGEIVVFRQTETLRFEEVSRRRISGLSSGRAAIAIADVMGDERPELLVAAGGKIEVYELGPRGPVGEPLRLGSGGDVTAFFIEDYTGNGMNDIVGVVPNAEAPIRLWMQRQLDRERTKNGVLGPEHRFEMPQPIEVKPVRFPDRAAASLLVIERPTRRIVLYDISSETIDSLASEDFAERDAAAEVFSFAGTASDRSIVAGDLTGDDLPDLLVTDPGANSILLFSQTRGLGFGEPERISAFKAPKQVDIGHWNSTSVPSVFILSEEEKAVGVSSVDQRTRRIGFPQPITVASSGFSPVAMAHAKVQDRPTLAVVVRDRRDHVLELHFPDGTSRTVALEGVNRPPQTIFPGDFDNDAHTDFILFTPNEPMVMVRTIPDEEEGFAFEVLSSDKMPQYGLVSAAGATNTALFDIDDNGQKELLIADANFIRACRYDRERGWTVVDQYTLPQATASLISLSVIETDQGPRLAATDRTGRRIVLMAADDNGSWAISESLRLSGLTPGAIKSGMFSGGDDPGILSLSQDGFALIRLAGERVALDEVASYRSDEENRVEHRAAVGDLNGDGFVDIAILDAGEQFCMIFTLSASRRMLLASEFKVFESRLFTGGASREFQPSHVDIADVTGDGADDLILTVHDRYIIYPQQTAPRR